MTVWFQPAPEPEPYVPEWPYAADGERPEEVAAVAEALRGEFGYIDIDDDPDEEQWDAIARVAIKALRG